jgi:hypothetical protein
VEKGGGDELYTLHEQAVAFARLMIKWNQAFGDLPIVEGTLGSKAGGDLKPNPTNDTG